MTSRVPGVPLPRSAPRVTPVPGPEPDTLILAAEASPVSTAPLPPVADALPNEPRELRLARADNARRPRDFSLAHLPARLILVVILTVQAVLSARLITGYTAFNDEALYLWAGRVEWSHWLHGTPVPLFQTYFSGAPVIYPALGALVNSVGGLTGARILSLSFMLGATCLLWGTAARLYDRRTAALAAAAWAVLGPTQHLGAYATYDAMALFLIALAAWCATGRRDKRDATGWILAAAAAMTLANATKYASALFDPVVIALAVASARPQPGGKAALRRGTLLTACAAGAITLLIHFGGPLYLRGIEETTLTRTGDTQPVLTVLGQSWGWVGWIGVLAAVGVALSWRRPGMLLTALLGGAILLVPLEQARIHTTTSLDKHVDFGAWFAAIAAGYAIRRLTSLPRPRLVRASLAAASVVGLLAAAQAGALQAREMLFGYWPNEARLIGALRPLTAHGGRYLAEGQYIALYYLPGSSWLDWSNTRTVLLPDGRRITVPVGGEGKPAIYRKLISQHYFSVVLLTFTDTTKLDNVISSELGASGYSLTDRIPFGPSRTGYYTIWRYRPVSRHDAA
ncbi:MAG: glycosyltransferase family 39 protein [Streptosporangiaceae bacterium]